MGTQCLDRNECFEHVANRPDQATTTSANLVGALLTRFNRGFRLWRQRRIDRAAFQQLNTLDDAMLQDIGLTRGDVQWANNLPISINAAVELEIRARGRSNK